MNFLKILLISFMTGTAMASGVGAEVLWVRGKVSYQNQYLRKGHVIALGSTLTTAKNSYVKVMVPKVGDIKAFSVVLGPESMLKLSDEPAKEGGHEFIKGAGRFYHEKMLSTKPALKTQQVSIGIRGTEYLLKVNPALGESEVVLFAGKIEMGNRKDPNNSIEIHPGQWGGLGGRFGKNIADPITLPKAVLASFEKILINDM